MIPLGLKIDLTKVKRKKYDCENAVYKRHGQEIKVTDYVNAGREGTEAKKIIGKTIHMDDLKQRCKDIPEAKEIVNMNLNPYMAARINKTAKIAEANIKAKLEMAKKEQELKKEAKEDDVNE